MPLCGCHGEPMRFAKDRRYRNGGFWRCAVKHRAAQRAFYHDPANAPAVLLRLQRKQLRDHENRLRTLTKEG